MGQEDESKWIRELKGSSRSLNNMVSILGTFFSYCKTHKWLSKEIDLLETMDLPEDDEEEISGYVEEPFGL